MLRSVRRNHKGWTKSISVLVLASAVSGFLWPAVANAQARNLPDFTDLVEKVGPSVVNIRTAEKVDPQEAGPNNGMDEEMLEFFRRFGIPLPNMPRPGRQPDEQPRGVGSGFVLSSDGYIMTNAHVVDSADEVLVTLTDKREFKARIVGLDKRTDVAVVKIEADNLPAVRLGDVSRLKVGEWVMAIGSPFGLENTVTAGIVSAKQRETGDYLPFIQTDVAINPGNSGGPLINMRGEVVGINSQIYSRSGGFMGISFAIPIDEAIRISDQLRASGRVSRGRIGVQIAPVNKEVAEAIGLGKPQGAFVRAVEPGGPAERAGIEAGDIIVRFNGKAIEKMADLPRWVGNTKPGMRATLTVFRAGASKELVVTVGEFDAQAPAKSEIQPPKSTKAAQRLGLTVSELSAAQKRELKINGGVRVDQAEGAAAGAGIREGDVILGVANQKIGGVKDFEAVLSRLDDKRPINLLLRRGEWAQYVVIRPKP